MRFVTTRTPRGAVGAAPAVSMTHALFEGLAPDGGLYMPETIDPWSPDELAKLPSLSLPEVGVRVLEPFAAAEISADTLAAVVDQALDFPIPLVEIESGVFALELFHGPTLAFKDVGARVMARLMAALGTDVTILTATSGDTGSAVANAFHGIANTRVVILYPDRRVSPTQEAQLTMFNGDEASNVRGYAIAGSFDDCQRLVKQAFADLDLRRRARLTSANSINVGRLLPQMVYYFHGVAELARRGTVPFAPPIVSTPSGNFGNLTAGLMARRAALPIARFVAATNANDVVPAYLATGRFEPRASVQTIANAMDVGNPSNFERLLWLYDGSADAVRRDVSGSCHRDEEVRATIRQVYERTGYVLDPHSAIGYLGITKGPVTSGGSVASGGPVASGGSVASGFSRMGSHHPAGIFLATAHPAKFSEVVEPIIGRPLDRPPSLAAALARPKRILRLDATLDAINDVVGA